ncbi:MAG: EAL domain-containing protein [Xanthomonadaceae bacterium]|jgi:diguanylate cyclase (GGDEF)-like protein/PAS domain S-box-containing protein|nr:EAL domain-containing protein [Xanthomonadaceae bacterium]
MKLLLIIETAVLLLLLALLLRRRNRPAPPDAASSIDRERDEHLKLALWGSGEHFWDYDLKLSRLTLIQPDDSPTLAHMLPSIHFDQSLNQLPPVHPQDEALVERRLHDHLQGRTDLFISEHRIDPQNNGNWIWVRARGRVVERDQDNHAVRMAGTVRDITANRHADAERRIASEVLRSMSEAVAVLDQDFRFVAVNPAFTRITGYSDMEALGKPIAILDSEHDREHQERSRQDLADRPQWQGNVWMANRNGQEILCHIKHNAVFDSNGKCSFRVVVLSDITEQKRAEQELRYLANYDALTGLPNRSLLAERLAEAILAARQDGSYIAVLFLDLDRFKDVNDSLGHAVGDRVLHAAAERVQQMIGSQHTVARLGGDEFTVILEHLKSREEATGTAQRVIEAFSKPLFFGDHREISVSISIGISLYPDHAQIPTDLLNHADTAMYHAKSAGRRTWQLYSPQMDETTQHRATLANSLRRVLERDELKLVYQPRYSLVRQRAVSVEALLRWRSDEFGDVSPQQFIQLAESTGSILDIGEWALRQACLTLRRWQQLGLNDFNISVNVSAVQLQRGDLPGTIERILGETGVPARNLELELTESAVMANFERNASILSACREIGTRLSIDDFGTGYSSLAYLKRLPITALKIDRAFIGDLIRDPDDEAITTAIINMGHALALTVIAEGVESFGQLRFLQNRRCDEVQGYLVSPPQEEARCLEYLIRSPKPGEYRPG